MGLDKLHFLTQHAYGRGVWDWSAQSYFLGQKCVRSQKYTVATSECLRS